MKRPWLPPLLVAAVVFTAFTPALTNDFVNWDDPGNFLENPRYRGFSADNLKWMLTDMRGHYMPLTWLSHGVDYVLWGVNPTGYHLHNLLLHTAGAVLLYFLLVAILKHATGGDSVRLRCAAMIGTLFFAIHPLRVESVVWATERRDVLSGLFFVLTLLAYWKARTTPGRRVPWLGLSIACFACSLLSKTTGMALPVLLLILDAVPLGRFRDRSAHRWILLEKAPYFALSIEAARLTLVAQYTAGAVWTAGNYGVIDSILQPAYRTCFYLWKTIVPVHLSPLYLLPAERSYGIVEYLLCPALVVGVTVLLIRYRKRWPAILAAWLAFLALLSPVLGLMQAGPHFAADRYTYLASMPLAALAALAFLRWKARPAIAVAALVLLCLAGATFRQGAVWKDSRTLWSHAIRVDPGNYVAYMNRAADHYERGKLEEALRDYEKAAETAPPGSWRRQAEQMARRLRRAADR
ncbi:MAG: hypothetical protein ACYTAF_12965 [Planctomycetota bacterium]